MSQIQRIVVRKGLTADVPALLEGEIGWDTDTATFRVGDSTITPSKIMTDKSTGTFDFATITSVNFPNITLPTNGLVDGLDLKTMDTGSGFVVRKGTSGQFGPVTIANSDQTLVITNGDGQAGNVDIRLHPNIIAIITGTTYLAQVTSDGTLTGDGTAGSPLAVVPATTAVLGVMQIASQAVTDAGTNLLQALTPGTLVISPNTSPLMIALQAKIMANLSLNTDASLVGNGGTVNLSVVQATETQLGGAEISTQAEADNALDDQRILTALKLASLGENSNTAAALRAIMRSSSGATFTSLPTNGSTQSLPLTFQSFDVQLQLTADAAQNADAYYLATTTATVQMFIGGVWQTVMTAQALDSGGAALGTDVPFHDSIQYSSGKIYVAVTATVPQVVSPLGIFPGLWNGDIRVNSAFLGAGTVAAVPVGNAGTVLANIVYI